MSEKVTERHNRILEQLSYRSVISIQELASSLDVSVETIRKDLVSLTQSDLVVRVHGGVGLMKEKKGMLPRNARENLQVKPKRAIAAEAVKLVRPNSTLLIESSTTTYELACALSCQPELLETLTVVTNSFSVCTLFGYGHACRRLFFLGGLCSGEELSTGGHYTSKMMQNFHVHQAFISAAGISNSMMLMGYLEDDVSFQALAIENADETILLLDHSKFASDAWLAVSRLDTFHAIVTDLSPEHPLAQKMQKYGYAVLFAAP